MFILPDLHGGITGLLNDGAGRKFLMVLVNLPVRYIKEIAGM
jgi:hypothetical protein